MIIFDYSNYKPVINDDINFKIMTDNSTINSMIDTIAKMCENTDDGKQSPFEALGYLKELDNTIKEALKYVMKVAIDEAKYEDKTFINGLHQFTKVNGRAIYNFKNIKEWSDIKSNLKEVEDKYKTAFRNYSNGIQNVTNDGEVLDLPEVKYTADTLSVKLNANELNV